MILSGETMVESRGQILFHAPSSFLAIKTCCANDVFTNEKLWRSKNMCRSFVCELWIYLSKILPNHDKVELNHPHPNSFRLCNTTTTIHCFATITSRSYRRIDLDVSPHRHRRQPVFCRL